MFHVTFEANLQGIIEEEGLIPGGNQNGFANSIGTDFFIEHAEDKIYITAEWAGMVPYIQHLKAKGEEYKIPVLLRIKISLDEFEEFTLYRDNNQVPLEGGEAPLHSLFFIDKIPIKHIEIATYKNPDTIYPDAPWSFKPLADYDVDEDSPTLLDLPGLEDLEGFLQYDMDQEVRDAIKEALEKTRE